MRWLPFWPRGLAPVGEDNARKAWHFSEMAYHPGGEELGNSLRNVVPSRVFDPVLGADLYHRYLDEWALCDELGLNIMVNIILAWPSFFS